MLLNLVTSWESVHGASLRNECVTCYLHSQLSRKIRRGGAYFAVHRVFLHNYSNRDRRLVSLDAGENQAYLKAMQF